MILQIIPKISRLLLIILLAFCLRIGVNIYLGIDSPPDRIACGMDAVEFEEMAWSAANGAGFSLNGQPTAFRAPGFPFLIFVIYKIFGRVYWLVHCAQILIGTASCFLLYLLTRQLTANRTVGLYAALIFAVMPLQIYYTGHYLSETLEIFFSILATCLVCRAAQSPPETSRYAYLISGVANGFAALVRPVAILYPVVLACCAFAWSRLKPWPVFFYGLLFCIGMSTVVFPWTYRNYTLFNRVTLVATNGGSTFWGANNEIVAKPGENWGSWISTNFAGELKKREVLSLPNQADRDKKEWALGIKYVRENVRDIPLLITGKYVRLLNPMPESKNRIFVMLVAVGNFFFYPLLAYGMLIKLRDKDHLYRFFPVIAQVISMFIVTGIFYGSSRFRSTYEPFLIIYAAIALNLIIERLGLVTGKSKNEM